MLSAANTAPALPRELVTENETAVGSTATEARLDTVKPTGPSGVAAATMATPAGWSRKAVVKAVRASTTSDTGCMPRP